MSIEKNKKKELLSDHLMRIGKRLKGIRTLDKKLSIEQLNELLDLPGAALNRFESGKGVNIFALLSITSWLNSQNINLKWFFLYDNSKEFKLNDNELSLYSEDELSVKDKTFEKRLILDDLEIIYQKINNIKSTIKN